MEENATPANYRQLPKQRQNMDETTQNDANLYRLPRGSLALPLMMGARPEWLPWTR